MEGQGVFGGQVPPPFSASVTLQLPSVTLQLPLVALYVLPKCVPKQAGYWTTRGFFFSQLS